MGNKIITEEDFWICTGGAVPAPFQTTQLSTKKASGHKYITVEDKSTLSWIDFGCRKLMLIMAIIAAVVVVAVVATGGAALAVVVAAGAAAGAAGAAYGAVLGALICGQKAAVARKWLNSKRDLIIQGQKAITGDHVMTCAVFGETITFAPQIKNWWQAISLGTANYISGIMEGMLAGGAIGLGGGLLAGGGSAFAAGGLRGLGQAALTALRSMPKNLLANVVSSFGKAGLAMRGLEGATNVLSSYGSTGRAGVGDFVSGVFGEEVDAYNAVRNIATGNGTWQDAANLAMLFAPDGGKADANTPTNTPTPDADAPTDAPAPDAPPTPEQTDDASTTVAATPAATTPAAAAEFDAFEGGPATPTPTTKPDAATIRENVLRNIEASRRAREASNFGKPAETPAQRTERLRQESIARDRDEITRLSNARDIDGARRILEPYVRARDIDAIIARLDVTSPKDGAVFWSGDKDAAGEFARQRGGVTLETTAGGRVVDNWDLLNESLPWDSGGSDFWGNLSEKYSNGATGIVNVVQTPEKAAQGGGYTWKNREQPVLERLQERGIVTDIIFNVLPPK